MPPRIAGYDSVEALAAALRAEFVSAAADPVRLSGTRVFVFKGARLLVVGDPHRTLVLEDGTHVSLTADVNTPAPDDDEGWLLPRTVRGS